MTATPARPLWISHFPVFGGPHNVALRLDAPLRAAGVAPTLLLPEEPGNAVGRLREGGVSVATIPLGRLRRTRDPREHARTLLGFLADVARIRRVIRSGRHDAVVLTGLANPHGAIAARLEGVPLVWQILDSATPRSVRAVTMPLVRRLADSVMFNGRALRALHCGSRSLRQPTLLFTGPVDTDRFRPVDAPTRAAFRAELGIPAGAPLVGTVANLNPMKGIEWFVRAAARIHVERPDSWFLVSGSNYETHRGYLARVREEMRSSTVPPERWILHHRTPERVYPALDVKLITSLPASEGRTTTGPEAMACGIPVVATDVGAVAEVIEHECTGLIVPPLDAGALARAAIRLLEDRELRDRLGSAGRRRAVERYSLGPSAAVHLEALHAARSFHDAR